MKPSDDLIVSSTEPTGEDRKKVWMQKNETENKIYIKNENNVYEEFIKKSEETYSIENPFIANENYEFVEESIFKQGKHYFGYLTIHKKTGTFDSTSESVATSEKIPVGNYHLFGLGSTSQWNVPTNNADVFLSSAKKGTILINCNGCAYVKFYIDFMVY